MESNANRPLTGLEILELPKGMYRFNNPNRKQRREALQKDRSKNKCRLLIYGTEKIKEVIQVIDLHASKNPLLNQSKVRFKRLKHFV